LTCYLAKRYFLSSYTLYKCHFTFHISKVHFDIFIHKGYDLAIIVDSLQ
jgi:hypothetical protein